MIYMTTYSTTYCTSYCTRNRIKYDDIYIYNNLCRLNSRNSGDGSIYPVPGWTDPPVASLGAEPDGSPSRL